MDQAEELRRIVTDASNGYWIPITIVSIAFSTIIALLLYIWNQMLKENERRHKGHEANMERQDSILTKVSESTDKLTVIVTELKVRQELQNARK